MLAQAGQLLEVARGLFDEGKHPKLKHIGMLLEQGMREDGIAVQGEFRIEDWETMEIRPFSDPRREGYGMIYDTVSNMRLTPKGRAAYERLKAAAAEAFK